MAIQIWLHRLSDSSTANRKQSRVARQLLDAACQFNGIHLADEHLGLPGLQLIELFQDRYGLGLSISHCRQLVAIALGEGDLGVDCEPLGRAKNWREIARHFFSGGEAESIGKLADGECEQVFLKHWVLKESYIKVIRGSIFGDLNRLVLIENSCAAKLEPADGRDWWAWSGSFGDCVIGLSSARTHRPELAFFECSDLESGAYTGVDQRVIGSFLPVC